MPQALPWQHPGRQQTSRLLPFPRLWQKGGCLLKNPEGRDRRRLLALPGQPLGWHTGIASHATLMAVRAPSSTDGSRILARDLPRHLHPAAARQACAAALEEPGLQETYPMPAPYSIARTRLSSIPFPCTRMHHLLSRPLPPHLPPMQVLFLPSPQKSQQRQSVTARSPNCTSVFHSWV